MNDDFDDFDDAFCEEEEEEDNNNKDVCCRRRNLERRARRVGVGGRPRGHPARIRDARGNRVSVVLDSKSHRLCHADAEPEEKIQRGDVGTRHGSVERDRESAGKRARGTRIERPFGLAKGEHFGRDVRRAQENVSRTRV